MATRAEVGPSQPLKGARIAGSLHMTIQTAVLIETLKAARRRRSLGILQHLLDAGPRRRRHRGRGTPVFAYKGESLKEYWDFTARLFDWHGGGTPNMILDDGGDATMLVHLGLRPRRVTPRSSTSRATRKRRSSCAPQGQLKEKPKGCSPNSRRTSTASPRRRRPACTVSTRCRRRATLLFPAINVNDSVTKSKFDNLYGCRESLVDAIRRGTDVMMAGKVAMVAGFGDVGKGSAASLRQAGCRVMVSEVDPICALQAAMEGYEVTTMEDAVTRADIFVTATGNVDIVTVEHMRGMKDRAIVCNIGHFDNEIQVAGLKNFKWHNVKPQVDEVEFADGKRIILLSEGRLVNLGNATGHPSFVMSASFTNQTLAQIELWTKTGQYQRRSTRCRSTSTRRSPRCTSRSSA